MGYYIETPMNTNKAEWLIGTHGAKAITPNEARQAHADGKGVVCVVNNGHFEAVAFIYSEQELSDFMPSASDHRPRRWLVMDLDVAKKLSGYNN